MKQFTLTILIFFAFGSIAYAATTQTSNVIVNPGNAANLASTTGLSTSEAQNIINQASAAEVNPEITIPAESATVSGNNLVIKGIATPNASIDILIQPASGTGGPSFGKSVADRYGVWSYTLAPTLANGAYSIQVTAQAGNGAPRQSQAIHFAVSGTGAGGGGGSFLSSLLGTSGNSFLIIIIAIIISLTFIVTVIVLAMVPYVQSRRGNDPSRMKSWEAPELVGMDETHWNTFVKDMEVMRHYLKVAANDPTHGPPSGTT